MILCLLIDISPIYGEKDGNNNVGSDFHLVLMIAKTSLQTHCSL